MEFRRGFKAEAERISLLHRQALGVFPEERLAGRRLARHLGMTVVSPTRIPRIPADILRLLGGSQDWSAAFLPEGDPPIVIYNPLNSPARTESDLMHEIAHLLLRHKLPSIHLINGVAIHEFDDVQEAEAAWLGGCLQIPRDGLAKLVKRGMTTSEIAAHYVASEEMVEWRRRVTAVDRQARRRS